MTLLELKKKVLELIEEYDEDATDLTNDPDIAAKLNSVINQVQFELCRMKKIPAKETVEITNANLDYDLNDLDNYYQLDAIVKYDADGNEKEFGLRNNFVDFFETGTAKIYYWKYPTTIDEETEDTYEFELSQDALEILPYGVAADLLKSDVSSSYGNIYAQRYESMIQRLDSRYNTGSVFIEGGISGELL